MPRFFNRVAFQTATTGQGSVVVSAPVNSALMTPAEAGVADAANTIPYLIEEDGDFEVGLGTYNTAGPTFHRNTVLASKIATVVGVTKMDLDGAAIIRFVANAASLEDFAIRSGPNEFGGGQRLLTQSPAFSATPAPDAALGQRIAFAAATGAVAIGVMSNCYVGMPFRFIILQDGTGGHAYTMNAAYINQPSEFVTAASKRQIIDGEVTAADGSNNMTEAVLSTGSWIEP